MTTWQVPGYQELSELGEGATGRVVLAEDERTGSPVAIKYLSAALLADQDFLGRFRREARLLGELEHPHVVRLYEYVESDTGAAIVMELVDGVSLRDLLQLTEPPGPEAALAVLKGSLAGLAAAHDAGVVHRDYKPENVIVDAEGNSTLVDFGIAAAVDADGGDVAESWGTPSYMAPEQWRGAPATPSCDVYAATATFFECLAGRPPYAGADLHALRLAHENAPIPSDEVPAGIERLITRGLAKDPGARPPSAAEFLTELEDAAGAAYGPDWEQRGRRRLARLAALLPLLFPLAQGGTGSATSVATTSLAKTVWLGIGTAVATVVSAAVLAGATLGGGSGDAPPGAGPSFGTTVQPPGPGGPSDQPGDGDESTTGTGGGQTGRPGDGGQSPGANSEFLEVSRFEVSLVNADSAPKIYVILDVEANRTDAFQVEIKQFATDVEGSDDDTFETKTIELGGSTSYQLPMMLDYDAAACRTFWGVAVHLEPGVAINQWTTADDWTPLIYWEAGCGGGPAPPPEVVLPEITSLSVSGLTKRPGSGHKIFDATVTITTSNTAAFDLHVDPWDFNGPGQPAFDLDMGKFQVLSGQTWYEIPVSFEIAELGCTPWIGVRIWTKPESVTGDAWADTETGWVC